MSMRGSEQQKFDQDVPNIAITYEKNYIENSLMGNLKGSIKGKSQFLKRRQTDQSKKKGNTKFDGEYK